MDAGLAAEDIVAVVDRDGEAALGELVRRRQPGHAPAENGHPPTPGRFLGPDQVRAQYPPPGHQRAGRRRPLQEPASRPIQGHRRLERRRVAVDADEIVSSGAVLGEGDGHVHALGLDEDVHRLELMAVGREPSGPGVGDGGDGAPRLAQVEEQPPSRCGPGRRWISSKGVAANSPRS